MQFKNRPNQAVQVNGKEIWISRSVAVLAIPLFYCEGLICVPLGRRSESMPDYAGQFSLPCGYLDWNETASEAMIREVWEEIGLDLTRFGRPDLGSLEQPYYVASDPKGDARQNVTLRFRFTFKVSRLPDLTETEECSEVVWLPVREAINLDLAFNHAEILKEAMSNG